MTENRFSCSSEQLAVGLLFVFIATLACFAPAQSDTWWHLRGGQDIWRSWSINLSDTYSSTARGALWPNHEWLTEVVFYAAYVVGGLALLTATGAAAVTLAWSTSWRLASGPFEVRLLLFVFAAAAATTHWALRPQVLSMALLAMTVRLLVAQRYQWLPVIFVIWTNLHGAVALGLVAVAAAFVAAVLTDRAVPRSLALAGFGCLLATLASPLGLTFWPEVVRSIERSRVSNLVEWRSPPMAAALVGFWVIAAALPMLAVLKRQHLDRRSATLAAIALAFLPLAATSFRNVSTFLLVGAPAVSTLIGLGRPHPPARVQVKENVRGNIAFLAAATLVAMAIVATAWWRQAPILRWRPISASTIDAIATCDRPVYNSYDAGGVLIWFVPDQPVFVDNRQDPYPLDFLREIHQVERDGKYERLFDRYQPRCAVTAPRSPVAERLRTSPGWALRHAEGDWAIFERR